MNPHDHRCRGRAPPRRKSRPGAESRSPPAALVLPLQRRNLGRLLTGHPAALPHVDLGLHHPPMQRGMTDLQLRRDMQTRRATSTMNTPRGGPTPYAPQGPASPSDKLLCHGPILSFPSHPETAGNPCRFSLARGPVTISRWPPWPGRCGLRSGQNARNPHAVAGAHFVVRAAQKRTLR